MKTIQDQRAEIDKLNETVLMLHEGFERQEAVLGEAVLVNESYQAQINELQKQLEACREENATRRPPVANPLDNSSDCSSPGGVYKEEGGTDLGALPEPSECDFSSLYAGLSLDSPPGSAQQEKPFSPSNTVADIKASTEKVSNYFKGARNQLGSLPRAAQSHYQDRTDASPVAFSPLPLQRNNGSSLSDLVMLQKPWESDKSLEEEPSFPEDNWVKCETPMTAQSDIWIGEYERSSGVSASERHRRNRVKGKLGVMGNTENTPIQVRRQDGRTSVTRNRLSISNPTGPLTTHALSNNQPLMTPKFEKKLVKDVADSVFERMAPLFGRTKKNGAKERNQLDKHMDDEKGFLKPTVAAKNKERGKIWGRVGARSEY